MVDAEVHLEIIITRSAGPATALALVRETSVGTTALVLLLSGAQVSAHRHFCTTASASIS